MDKLAISVRRAQPSDAPALTELVNRAYDVEKFFVDGERTSLDEIHGLVTSGAFLVLENDTGIVGAVYVEARPGQAGYIGLVSVDPSLQGQGIGTRLVRIAEAMLEAMGATTVQLRVVNLREELWRWYKSLGYHEVGTAPFPGPVKKPCHFVELRRSLV